MKWEGQRAERQRRGPARRRRRSAASVGGRSIGHRHVVDRARRGLDLRHQPADGAGPARRRRRRRAMQSTPAHAPPAERPCGGLRLDRAAPTPRMSGPTVFQAAGGQYQAPKLVLFRGSTPTACGRGESGDGPVLLPGRPQGLPRPRLLRHPAPAPRRAGRLRAGLRDRARGRPPRAEPARHHGQGRRAARHDDRGAGERGSRCGSSCRPTAWPASGRTIRSRARAGSSRATSRGAERRRADRRRHAAAPGAAARCVPETFTHGTSAQRVAWFRRGLDSGSVKQCNTFDAKDAVNTGRRHCRTSC